MVLTSHSQNWWLLRKGDSRTIEFVRRSIPPLYRRFDTEAGGWLIHDKYIEAVRQLIHSSGVLTEEDPYAVLHLRPTAPPAIIRAVWRELAKTLHPDHGGDVEQFKRVKAAYDKLTKV